MSDISLPQVENYVSQIAAWGESGDPLGLLVLQRRRIRDELASKLRALRLPDGIAEPHAEILMRSLARHVTRWLNAEIQQWVMTMALVPVGSHRDARAIFHGFASSPDTLMEVLSLPSIRGTVNFIRQRGTKEERQKLRNVLAGIVRRPVGRPPGRRDSQSSDVSLVLEVDAQRRHLLTGYEYVRSQRRRRRASHFIDPDRLRELGYNESEIDVLESSRTLAQAVNKLVTRRHRMRVATLRARVSRGRRILGASEH